MLRLHIQIIKENKKVVAKYYIWSSKVQIIKDQMSDMTHIFEDKKKLIHHNKKINRLNK